MSNSMLTEKGRLLYGLADSEGNLHYDFEIGLLTVEGELNVLDLLAAEFPNLEELKEDRRFTYERAVYLSQMIIKIGTLKNLTFQQILSLVAEDFPILIEAEFKLRKKRIESTQKKCEKSKKNKESV